MPQLDYDYDYLATYEANRQYNNSKKKVARDSARYNAYRSTSEKTKEQIKRFLMDGAYDSQVVVNGGAVRTVSLPSRVIDRDEEEYIRPRKRTFDYESNDQLYVEPMRMFKKNETFDFDMARKTNYNATLANKPEELNLEETEEALELKREARKAAIEKVGRYLKNGLLFVMVAVVALFICYRYSLINEKFNQVSKAKKELVNAQTVNEQLQAEIDSETDISYIENYAKYQLGMQKPQDSQIMYINVEKQDKIYTPIETEEEETSWFDQLMEKIANIF